MTFRRALRAVAFGSIGGLLMLSPALGKTLKVGGTGAVTPLLSQMAPAFLAETGITLDVIAGIGTSGGVTLRIDEEGRLRIEGFLNADPVLLTPR